MIGQILVISIILEPELAMSKIMVFRRMHLKFGKLYYKNGRSEKRMVSLTCLQCV